MFYVLMGIKQMLSCEMLAWLFIGLNIITKVQGYANGVFPEACESMSPLHRGRGGVLYTAKTSEAPYTISYTHGSSLAEPITVFLNSTDSRKFDGFMLVARTLGDTGVPMGKFLLVEPDETRLLTCGGSSDSTVAQTNNIEKTSIQLKWTNNTAEEAEQTLVLRATFVQSLGVFWENVTVSINLKEIGSAETGLKCLLFIKEQTAATLVSFDCIFKVVKTELSNLVMVMAAGTGLGHGFVRATRITCTLFCAGFEIASMVLFCLGETFKVKFVALLSVVMVLNVIELLLVFLRVLPSHELNDIHNIVVKVCCVAGEIFAIAVIFVTGYEVYICKKAVGETYLLHVMAAFTACIILFIIWDIVINTVVSQNGITIRQNQKKNTCVTVTMAVMSLSFVLGTMFLSLALADQLDQ